MFLAYAENRFDEISPEIEAKDAQARATERAQSEAQRLAQEMGLPPGMKLPV